MRTGEEARRYIDNMKAEGAVAVRPEKIDGWEQMTEEEQRQALLQRFKQREAGVLTHGPMREPVAAADAGDPDLFSPDDPTAILSGRAERYRMPNGKWVWVHPCSAEEATVINARAIHITQERHNLGGLEDKRWDSPEIAVERQIRGKVLQAIHCCRKGPEATSGAIFSDPLKHAEWLMREPGYVDAIEEIVVLSNSLSSGIAEAAFLKEAMIGFFARLQSFAETWNGRLSADSGPTLLPEFCKRLEDCATSASSMKQPESLSGSAFFAWSIVLRDAPPAEEA
jgi:hypothetical protein